MKSLKTIIYAAAAAVALPLAVTSCDDWTEPEAEDYYQPNSEAYYRNLHDYFASPHKKMFGWFGNWSGTLKSNSLTGLPDSVDYVSLWGRRGMLSDLEQADLDAFQARGSKGIFCWIVENIGNGLTPDGEDPEQFWGFTKDDEASCLAASERYAQAIVDSCTKYRVQGFDLDMELWGTLINPQMPSVINHFLRYLCDKFHAEGKMCVVDIPGGTGWLSFYDILEDDVLLSLDQIGWQTYELNAAGLDRFFDAVEQHKPQVFKEVLAKSIICATFERAVDKHLFYDTMQSWKYHKGYPHGGMGAYHIEYDYAGNPDYPYVRGAISAQNPPIRN